MSMLSVVIPSRKEPYLKKTIEDILQKAQEDIEVIAVLDGYWTTYDDIVHDKRVHYLHFPQPRGMRNAINAGVALSRGKYLLKCDAHVMFGEGFDAILKADSRDRMVQIPRRKRLNPETWTLVEDSRPPIDYMGLDESLSGVEDRAKNLDPALRMKLIDDIIAFQGSCWFMEKDTFYNLDLMDEKTYGPFWKEAQEIAFKCFLSNGRVVVNKKTWYAHWHKTGSRGYALEEKQNNTILKWKTEKMWTHQLHSFDYLLERFPYVHV